MDTSKGISYVCLACEHGLSVSWVNNLLATHKKKNPTRGFKLDHLACGWCGVKGFITKTVEKNMENKGYNLSQEKEPDTSPLVSTLNPLDVQVGGMHYKIMPIQPVEYAHKNGLGYCVGNIVKYVTRYKHKNGLEDLRKAQHYLELLIALEYPEEGGE